MDTFSIGRAVLRRWWVVVPILLATAAGAYMLGARIPPNYTTSGSFLLMEQVEIEPAQVSARVLAELVQDSDVAVPHAEDSATAGDYRATAADGGVIRVTAVSDNAAVAVQTVRRVLDELGPLLDRRQDVEGVPSEVRRQVEQLHRPFRPVMISWDPLRFEASGSAQLVGPGTEAAGMTNPIGGSTARDLLESQLEDPEVVAALTAAPTADYNVSNGDGPVFRVSAGGNDPEAVRQTVQSVMEAAPGVLDLLQETASVNPLYSIRPFQPADDINVDGSTSVRAVLALTAVGIALAVIAAVVTDVVAAGLAGRRRQDPYRYRGAADQPLPGGRRRGGAADTGGISVERERESTTTSA